MFKLITPNTPDGLIFESKESFCKFVFTCYYKEIEFLFNSKIFK